MRHFHAARRRRARRGGMQAGSDSKGTDDMTATSPGAVEGAKAAPVSDAAWKCLQGAYDLQVHVAPDVIERRIDDLDLAKEFLGRGLKGFVLKSHYFPTAERARRSEE